MSSSYFGRLVTYWRYRPTFSLFACSSALGIGYAGPILYDSQKRKQELSLNPSTFTPYRLVAKYPISTTSSIFILRPPRSDEAANRLQQAWDQAATLWSVQIKQPQLQIGREYTPVPPTQVLKAKTAVVGPPGSGSADLHLLIRKEANGEMTTYLDNLPLESVINLRGPYQDVKLPGHVHDILFLAGGTGISPAMQVAHIMAKRPGARITILWANRQREECAGARLAQTASSGSAAALFAAAKSVVWPESQRGQETLADSNGQKGLMIQMLEELQTQVGHDRLRVEYFVDEDDVYIRHGHVSNLLAESRQVDQSGAAGAKLVLVSGPPGFIDYWAGSKGMQDGREVQGPLGGVLGNMKMQGWKVWKL